MASCVRRVWWIRRRSERVDTRDDGPTDWRSSRGSLTSRGGRSRNVVGMTPEEIADLAHLRRARDLIDREYAAAARCPGHGACRAHVARALLAQVPCCLRRDAVLVSHDATHRARKGVSASGDVGHRHVRRRRLYVARLVQLALHRDRRRDAVAVPRARPPRRRGRSVVREHGRDATAAHQGNGLSTADSPGTEQDRRSTRRVGARTVVA